MEKVDKSTVDPISIFGYDEEVTVEKRKLKNNVFQMKVTELFGGKKAGINYDFNFRLCEPKSGE